MSESEPFATAEEQRTGRWLATSAAGLFVLAGAQIVVGILLGTRFGIGMAAAHSATAALQADPALRFLEAFHYWGGHLFAVLAAVHLTAMLWLGWCRPPHTWRWIGTLVLFACALGFLITGHLLPGDRHGARTAIVESGVAARMPAIGETLRQAVLAGPEFGDATHALWYNAHRFLLPLLLVLGTAGAFAVHYRRKDAAEDRRWMWLPLALAAGLGAALPVTHGRPWTPGDLATEGAQPGWYVLPLHGSLRFWEQIDPSLGWVGAGLVPMLFAAYLLAVPRLSRTLTLPFLRIGFVVFVLYFAAATALFGGAPANPFGDRDASLPTVAQQAAAREAAPIDELLAARGAELFERNGCAGCHGPGGLGGAVGPKLTEEHLTGRDADWYIRFVKDPPAVKPGSTMPGFPNLPEEDLRALAEWLRGPKEQP